MIVLNTYADKENNSKMNLNGKSSHINTNVTIGVITFERCESLKRCLTSIEASIDIIRENSIDISVIVVEDSSNGKFCEINLSDFHFRLVHVKNEAKLGPPESRNRVIDMASGDFILFIDDDNEIDSMMIPELVNFACKNDFGVIGPQAYSSNFASKTYSGLRRTRFLGRNIEVYSDEPYFEVDDVQNCFMFERKVALNNAIRFDPKYAHEIAIFCLRFKQLGKKKFIINAAKTIHHHEGSHFTIATFSYAWLARFKVWKEEGDIFPILFSPLSILAYDIYYFINYMDKLTIRNVLLAIKDSYLNALKGLLA
jgi:GT2 family glycosyltransferase